MYIYKMTRPTSFHISIFQFFNLKIAMQDILQEYIKTPLQSKKPEKYTVMYEEWNIICDDSIEIYLNIDKDILKEINYTGQLSMTWQGSLALLNDLLLWKNINEIKNLTVAFFADNWVEVSHRRKKTVSLPLVAIINAIKTYQWDKDLTDIEDFAYE